MILQDNVDGKQKRKQQCKSWSDHIKDWSELTFKIFLSTGANRIAWMRVYVTTVSSCLHSSNDFQVEALMTMKITFAWEEN